MKCLLCTSNFQEKNSLQNQYIDRHKINSSNWFFKALFKKDNNKFFIKKCYRCEQFLTSRNKEKIHKFLKHYQKGGQLHLNTNLSK